MGVTTDAGNTFETKVEGYSGKARTSEEGHEEGAETAVNMKRELAFPAKGEAREGGDVVNDTVREVRRRAYQ